MAITTLISWYDENPQWLAEAIYSVASFSNQVIAMDGAYALYPNAQRVSPVEQSEAIHKAARESGIGCVIVEPTQPWRGNEIEKRSTLFAIAESFTDEATDWYFILDSDEYVYSNPYLNLPSLLFNTSEDVCNVNVWEKGAFWRFYPKFFRALRGIRAVGNHWTYELPDGRRLWGHGHRGKILEPAADFMKLQVCHRANRSHEREKAAQKYYTNREAAREERDP